MAETQERYSTRAERGQIARNMPPGWRMLRDEVVTPGREDTPPVYQQTWTDVPDEPNIPVRRKPSWQDAYQAAVDGGELADAVDILARAMGKVEA